MAGDDTLTYKYKQWLMGLPGKRGIDIPEDRFDQIHQVASGITQQLWGRPPTPWQLAHLHQHTDGSAQAVHDAFAHLPHPHAPSLAVGEYEDWKKALQTYKQHQR